jgi:diaminopimelate decarboxylase
MHSGSQMRDLKAQREALTRLVALAYEINDALALTQSDRRIEILDIGGGLPTESIHEQSDMRRYAELVYSVEGIERFKLVTEFGQWVNAECGVALSRIEYVLDGHPPKLFIHLGADMFTRDIYTQPRPFPLSLWTAGGERAGGATKEYDIAGPLCFAGDYLARNALLPEAEEDQWLCIDHVGANTYSLWSRHCSRDVPAIWAWDGEKVTQWSPRRAIGF